HIYRECGQHLSRHNSPCEARTSPNKNSAGCSWLAGKMLRGYLLPVPNLYDPGTGVWTPTGSMTDGRASHTATLLPDGRVLVAGGWGLTGGIAIPSAEIYEPGNGTWTPTGSMSIPRVAHMAALITNAPLSGMVLVSG